MSLSISYIFSHTVVHRSGICMRVTASRRHTVQLVQQMNILIRRPFHWQKPGDCTLIAFYPCPPYPFTGLSVLISVILCVSVHRRPLYVSLEPTSRSRSPLLRSLFARKSTLIYIYKYLMPWEIPRHPPPSTNVRDTRNVWYQSVVRRLINIIITQVVPSAVARRLRKAQYEPRSNSLSV